MNAPQNVGEILNEMDTPQFIERVAHDVWRDARLLSTTPVARLLSSRAVIEEAREALNDALAKIDRRKVA